MGFLLPNKRNKENDLSVTINKLYKNCATSEEIGKLRIEISAINNYYAEDREAELYMED